HDAGWLARGTREAQIGKGLGEIVGGFFQIVAGGGGVIGGGAASGTGIGAPAGVPVVVASADMVTGGLANVTSGLAGLHVVMSQGAGAAPGDKPASLGPRWKPRDIQDPANRDGCDRIAKQIRKRIGGTIHRITLRKQVYLGGYREKNRGWFFHDVVVKD